jgi:dihydropteroate synthase
MTKAKLMGVINVTPNSFYQKSRTLVVEDAVHMAMRFQEEGADILDLGGESSHPGALPVAQEEEMERVIPVIEALKDKVTIPLSIDTYKPEVAKAAIKAGATLINDISGFSNPDMVALAAEKACDICVMHMEGNPQNMQNNPFYQEGVIHYQLKWFEKRIEKLLSSGIKPEKIIVDPGIGFGKTVAHNLEIIHNLPEFKRLGFRVLLGISRKSFLSKILNKPSEELLSATLAMNTIGIASKVDIIRVHDVKEHRSIIDVMDAFLTHQ